MSDQAKDKMQRRERRASRVFSEGSQMGRTFGKFRNSVSTLSCIDDTGLLQENAPPAVKLENTYQMGPYKRFPIAAVTEILKDVLTNYLQQEKYEAEWSPQLTKTICEVIRSCVKDLMIPRYKIVVLVHIGQLSGQSMQNSSRCLWDAANDTFASYSFKNRSLFSVATVYVVYFE
ncbi:hypothetical protein LDENG_00169130 [Lucifuga dentata]|nr:hypothetical protein LDENG_00169130 [Lucifuga dentata]